MLQLERGDGESAYLGLERALTGVGWPSLQRRGLVLASLARVAVATGRMARAEEIITELETQPRRWPMPSIRALTAEARAELFVARDDAAAAMRELRMAAELWTSVDAAINAADARIRLAALMIAAGDRSADLELQAVEAMAARVQCTRLTLRSAELRQMAQGRVASSAVGRRNDATLIALPRRVRIS